MLIGSREATSFCTSLFLLQLPVHPVADRFTHTQFVTSHLNANTVRTPHPRLLLSTCHTACTATIATQPTRVRCTLHMQTRCAPVHCLSAALHEQSFTDKLRSLDAHPGIQCPPLLDQPVVPAVPRNMPIHKHPYAAQLQAAPQ